MADDVHLRHPPTGRTMTSNRRLFETVWAASGWVETTPDNDRPSTADRKAVWVDYATRNGVDPSGTKADIIARF
jgi:hypothetical protein